MKGQRILTTALDNFGDVFLDSSVTTQLEPGEILFRAKNQESKLNPTVVGLSNVEDGLQTLGILLCKKKLEVREKPTFEAKDCVPILKSGRVLIGLVEGAKVGSYVQIDKKNKKLSVVESQSGSILGRIETVFQDKKEMEIFVSPSEFGTGTSNGGNNSNGDVQKLSVALESEKTAREKLQNDFNALKTQLSDNNKNPDGGKK